MIKSKLVTVEYELQEAYSKYYLDWDNFIEEVFNIMDFYKEEIYKIGKMVLCKRIGVKPNSEITTADIEFLNSLSIEEFLNKLKDAIINYTSSYEKIDLYSQIVTIIIGKCIQIFKMGQIKECVNQKIEKVKFEIDDKYACDDCKFKSQFIYNTDAINIDFIHPYCKISIIPIDISIKQNIKTPIANFYNVPNILISDVKNITTKLSIYLKNYISNKEFIFENCKGIYYKDNIVHISNDLISSINIKSIILRELLIEKLLSVKSNFWEMSFNELKKNKFSADKCTIYPIEFVNNLSTINSDEYYMQNVITYILYPSIIKQVNIKAYNELYKLFDKEFLKG